VRLHPLAKLGRCVMLTVSDTGVGMEKETQSRIFEPFFTTKEVGTGLGLSTVLDIVKQSAGSISVVSEEQHGTTFTILLPRCEDVSVAISASEAATPLRGGSETILLVEDAAALRGLTRHLLQDCGYTVLDSGNAADALRIAGEHEGPLPLMITDIVMPGVSGFVLAQKLAEERPGMHVLYTSGYAADAVAERGAQGPDWAFLEKPYTRDALIRKVRELLDSSPIHLERRGRACLDMRSS